MSSVQYHSTDHGAEHSTHHDNEANHPGVLGDSLRDVVVLVFVFTFPGNYNLISKSHSARIILSESRRNIIKLKRQVQNFAKLIVFNKILWKRKQ